MTKKQSKHPEWNYEKEYRIDYIHYVALKNYLANTNQGNEDWKSLCPKMLEQMEAHKKGVEAQESPNFATLEIKLVGNKVDHPQDFIVILRGRTSG
jgi:hypothetical protein